MYNVMDWREAFVRRCHCKNIPHLTISVHNEFTRINKQHRQNKRKPLPRQVPNITILWMPGREGSLVSPTSMSVGLNPAYPPTYGEKITRGSLSISFNPAKHVAPLLFVKFLGISCPCRYHLPDSRTPSCIFVMTGIEVFRATS